MRIFIGCLVVVACSLLFALPVEASTRQMRQTHSIEIEVECIDAAIEIIQGLNGYNLESHVFINEVWGRSPQRQANFTRRVEDWAFRHVQEELRRMGEVLWESENAQFLGAQIGSVVTRLVALNQEIDRLTVMMAASDSLDVLIAIDSRLSQLHMERNQLIGQQNVLLAQAASPVITIILLEIPEERPALEPQTFGARIGSRFSNSWRNTIAAGGNFLVFIARISVPLITLSLPLGFLVFVIRLWHKRKNTNISAETNQLEIIENEEGQE